MYVYVCVGGGGWVCMCVLRRGHNVFVTNLCVRVRGVQTKISGETGG